MTFAPFVIVTATTEIIRELPRIRVNEAYTAALAEVGLVPMVLPPVSPSMAAASLVDVAGLVLTGGEDIDPARFGQEKHPANGEPHAARDGYELALAHAAAERRIPTLAICRGAQIMNVALGGTLVQDIPSQHASSIDHAPQGKRGQRTHDVNIETDSRLARIVGTTSISTNSSHHQSIDQVGRGLRVVASSPDGIVEAVEPSDPAWWMVAVQWHPEELTATPEDWDRRLFAAFADAVRGAAYD
jgi:putative glutamine amidotransferase